MLHRAFSYENKSYKYRNKMLTNQQVDDILLLVENSTSRSGDINAVPNKYKRPKGKNMSIKIVVDSTADLKKEIAERLVTVPLTVRFGDEEFIDGITLSRREFYEKLIETDQMPVTSQATPDGFMTAVKPLVEAGHEVIILTVSSKLSGTFQSATIAAGEFDGRVFAVDTKSVAVGSGILAELALTLAESGSYTAAEIAEILTEERENIKIVAMLDTLEYLKKGGRISKTVAFAGGLLSIKPVVSLNDGEITVLGKARGSKQGNNLLVEEIGKAGGIDFTKPLLLGYTGLSDILLTKYIEDSRQLWENNTECLATAQIGSVVGTHAGPGAIAVAFFAENKI